MRGGSILKMVQRAVSETGARIDMRHDPQLRIVPSMPIILQMCAPKHATFV